MARHLKRAHKIGNIHIFKNQELKFFFMARCQSIPSAPYDIIKLPIDHCRRTAEIFMSFCQFRVPIKVAQTICQTRPQIKFLSAVFCILWSVIYLPNEKKKTLRIA